MSESVNPRIKSLYTHTQGGGVPVFTMFILDETKDWGRYDRPLNSIMLLDPKWLSVLRIGAERIKQRLNIEGRNMDPKTRMQHTNREMTVIPVGWMVHNAPKILGRLARELVKIRGSLLKFMYVKQQKHRASTVTGESTPICETKRKIILRRQCQMSIYIYTATYSHYRKPTPPQ